MENLVISNGMAGLVSARWLTARGIDFSAFDAASTPGQGDPAFAWRFRENSIDIIASLFEEAGEWTSAGALLHHKPKNAWIPYEGDIETQMKPFVAGAFRIPCQSVANFIEPISKAMGEKFSCNRFPIAIDVNEKTVSMNDGTTVTYERLIWAAPLSKLKGILSPSWKTQLGRVGKIPGPTSIVGFEWATDVRPFAEEVTVVAPFRFKDDKLKAYGIFNQKTVDAESGSFVTNWLTIAPPKVAANNEEVAKCVKSMRREVLKEFPEVEGHIKHEKILHYECFIPDKPIIVESLEVLPSVFYVGPEMTTNEDNASLWGPEATVLNLKKVFH